MGLKGVVFQFKYAFLFCVSEKTEQKWGKKCEFVNSRWSFSFHAAVFSTVPPGTSARAACGGWVRCAGGGPAVGVLSRTRRRTVRSCINDDRVAEDGVRTSNAFDVHAAVGNFKLALFEGACFLRATFAGACSSSSSRGRSAAARSGGVRGRGLLLQLPGLRWLPRARSGQRNPNNNAREQNHRGNRRRACCRRPVAWPGAAAAAAAACCGGNSAGINAGGVVDG